MKTVRKIEGKTKNILYCRWVERKDKRMVKLALKTERKYVSTMMKFRRYIVTLVGYGSFSVEEGFELHQHITKAIEVVTQRNAEDIAERVVDLSVQRIAQMIGGKVVKEDVS